MNRKRVALFGGVLLSVMGLAVVILWFTLHTRVRMWIWDRTADQPLDEQEALSLAACESPSWSAWLKISNRDLDISCGEAWVATELAEKLGSADRARWMDLRVADRTAPARFRMRAAMGMLLAGWGPSAEPAWLAEQLTPTERARAIRAAAESDAVAAHVGPGLGALATAARVRLGTVSPAAALPALDWLAQVDDARAEAEASLTATVVSGVFPDLVGQVRSRRAAGRPVAGLAGRWSAELLAHPECEAPGDPRHCATLWTAILDRWLVDGSLETGVRLPPEPEVHPRVAQILTTIGARSQERRAAAYAVDAAAAWVSASPEPGTRLRSLAEGPTAPTRSLARFPWDGVGPPFLAAVMVTAIGDLAKVPVEVRVGDSGDSWIRIDGEDVLRACDPDLDVAPADGPEWPPDAVLAGALAELAAASVETGEMMRGLKLATAAERIDPLVAGPLAVRLASGAPPELEAGRRIGVSLLRPVFPPTGAETLRRRAGEHGPTTCDMPATEEPPPSEP